MRRSSAIVVMVLITWPRASGGGGEGELPVVLAVLMLGSGLVFARFLERWL